MEFIVAYWWLWIIGAVLGFLCVCCLVAKDRETDGAWWEKLIMLVAALLCCVCGFLLFVAFLSVVSPGVFWAAVLGG